MIAVVWACAVAGDLTSFYLGRRLGRAFIVKHGAKVQITEERLEQVERFFDRHGGKAILIGRFVGLVRAIAPFLAGSSGMPLRRFVPYDVIGAGLWGSTFVAARLHLLAELQRARRLREEGRARARARSSCSWWRSCGSCAGCATRTTVRARGVWLDAPGRAARRCGRWRACCARCCARRGGPPRFVWDRVTPGDLGLEFTTLLAVAGVGAFVFVWDLVRIEQDTGLLTGDEGDAAPGRPAPHGRGGERGQGRDARWARCRWPSCS